jgi:LysM repeat protein
MKKIVLCFVLILSFFVLFACASEPPASEPAPQSPSAPVSSPAPTTPAPTPSPQQSPNVARPTDLILEGAETYTVVWGDTLTKISRNKYRNGFYYPLIMMASSIVKDQDKITPGMKLTIPNLQANLNDSIARASIKRYILEIASLTERKRPRDAAGLRSLANSL